MTMKEMLLVAVVVLLFAVVFWLAPKRLHGDVVVINCGVSEISPDFTPAMRQACREARKPK
jgi:hypothetical protein